jgi:homoserine acetyltransferase
LRDPPSGAKFEVPRVRIGDDVVAQERLLRQHFGIERLALVISGFDGGAADVRVGCPLPGPGTPTAG